MVRDWAFRFLTDKAESWLSSVNENADTSIGEELLTRFAGECDQIATMDKNPKLEGRNMSMFLSPRTTDKQSNKK